MKKDRAADHAQRKHRSVNYGARHQQQHGGDQLRDAAADPPPGLHPHRRKYVDGFLSPAELEEQSLEQDRGSYPAQDPARNHERSAVFHTFLSEIPRIGPPRFYLNSALAAWPPSA